MLRKRVVLGATQVMLVAGVAAGCVGSGRELSKEEYVSKLNEMCEDFGAREERIGGEPRTIDELVVNGPRIVDAFEKAIFDKVETLEAPDEIADQAHRLLRIAGQQRDVLRGLVDAAKDGDLNELRQLVSKNDALNRASNALFRELGADACS